VDSSTALRATPIALVLAVAIVSGLGEEARGHGLNIHVGNYYFCDPTFTNQVCDRSFQVSEEVGWEVFDGIHTITECDESFSVCPPPGGFELGISTPGELKLRVFGTPGIYEYRCNYHPNQMRGRVFVGVEAPASTPGPTTPAAVTTTAPPSLANGGETAAPSASGGNSESAVQPVAAPAGGGGSGDSSSEAWLIATLGLGGALLSIVVALALRRRLR
jgi:plastocyanin